MDIQMPGMDGVEATQKIKQLNKRIPPIICVTANTMKGDEEKYSSEGLDDYLAKPVKLDTLHDK